MNKPGSVAQQIAEAASAFEQRRTGQPPTLVTVAVSEETLVITLYGVSSPAAPARDPVIPAGTVVQVFHLAGKLPIETWSGKAAIPDFWDVVAADEPG